MKKGSSTQVYLDTKSLDVGKALEEAWQHLYFIVDSEMQMERQHLHAWNCGFKTRLCSRLQ
jgi:hypothetical protein